MPILDQAATINMALSRNGCVMPRELTRMISKYWIFPNPFLKDGTDPDTDSKKAGFREEGIAYTVRQIRSFLDSGVNGIHLYTLNKFPEVELIAKESGLL